MRSYPSIAAARSSIVRQGPAEWLLPISGRKPIRLIANDAIFAGFDDKVLQQAINAAEMPGAEQVFLGADAHVGFGIAVGTAIVSSTHIYPPVVGPDACCSMGLLQTDVPESAISDKTTRRAIINAICERIPTGVGSRQASKAHRLDIEDIKRACIFGATENILAALGVPVEWRDRLENVSYSTFDTTERLHYRLTHDLPVLIPNLESKLMQANSCGAGNHFISLDIMRLDNPLFNDVANQWGLLNGRLSTLSHCGSRGFGYQLMAHHERTLQRHFETWNIPFPGDDKHLIYAPIGTQEAQDYLDDLHLAANFAVVNHLLIHSHVLGAIQEVLPGAKGQFVYHVSHNIGQKELIDGSMKWIFRKGATRAFPPGHPLLRDTRFAKTGQPILLPGNARDGSVIMLAQEGAKSTAFTVNHGSGRRLGRKEAKRTLVQADVERGFTDAGILYNGRTYPLDEAPGAYKEFDEVTKSVEAAGLALTVARLETKMVIKDMDQSAEGAA